MSASPVRSFGAPRRRRPRQATLPVAPPPPPTDPQEVARFQREQPPDVIPPRAVLRADRGLVAFAVLPGYRILR